MRRSVAIPRSGFSRFFLATLLLVIGCGKPPGGATNPTTTTLEPAGAISPGKRDGAGTAGRPRYNVLLILVDDLNDWISPLEGHPGVETPEFERLAKNGLLFENAYCDAPACNPSRTALLSGLRPTTTGVYFNGQPYLSALPESYTLVEYFAAHGYRTLGTGKIFHSYNQGKHVWDEYFRRGPNPKPDLGDQEPLFEEKHFSWGPVDAEVRQMADYRAAAAVAEWLRRPDLDPFFMVVGFSRPHLPWNVPQEFFDQYPVASITLPAHRDDDLSDVPPMGVRLARPIKHQTILDAGAWKTAIQGYLASVTFADRMLNVVMKAFRRSSYRDNTVVVVASDHGYHLGEKEHWGKYTLWRRATRIPLIVMVPGSKSKGRRTSGPVTLVDLYPTLADLCGLPAPQDLDGTSFAPLFDHPSRAWPEVALTVHRRGNYAVRDERWSYLRYSDGGEELYDLKSDPMEWDNLAANPESALIMKALGAHIPKVEAPNAPIAFSPTDIRQAADQILHFFPAQKLIEEIRRSDQRSPRQP